MHVLDNPVWHALTGTARNGSRACGSRRPVRTRGRRCSARSPTIATRRRVGRPARAHRPGRRRVLRPPRARRAADWTTQFVAPCRQMGLPDATAPRPRTTRSARVDDVVPLTASDVPEMLALVERTRPGPFLHRARSSSARISASATRRRLVAMAGERLHPPGFTEISAVCTDAAYRGTGSASRLVRASSTASATGARRRSCTSRSRTNRAHRVYADARFRDPRAPRRHRRAGPG